VDNLLTEFAGSTELNEKRQICKRLSRLVKRGICMRWRSESPRDKSKRAEVQTNTGSYAHAFNWRVMQGSRICVCRHGGFV
jgi:hypothetical protein